MKPVAVVFDLYGTLIDIEALRERVMSFAPDPDSFVQLWRDRQLALSFAMGDDAYSNFDELTARALDETVNRLGLIMTAEERAFVLAGWVDATFFADVPSTIQALKKRNVRTAVLTNGTSISANRALEHAGIRDALETVLTADMVQRYKPEAAVYQMAIDYFHCSPRDIVFVSSNDWDASGGARVGFESIWCNRGSSTSRRPERTITSLDELITILDTE